MTGNSVLDFIIALLFLLGPIIFILYLDDDTTPWRTAGDSPAIRVGKILLFFVIWAVAIVIIGKLYWFLLQRICPCPCP